MIEQLLQGHLEELRVIRENAARSRTERGVGPDSGGDEREDDNDEDGGDEDLGLDEVLVDNPVLSPTSERPLPNPRARERSRSPPQEYHGMYS